MRKQSIPGPCTVRGSAAWDRGYNFNMILMQNMNIIIIYGLYFCTTCLVCSSSFSYYTAVLIITVGRRPFADHLVHVTGQFAMCSDKLAGQYFSASTSSEKEQRHLVSIATFER